MFATGDLNLWTKASKSDPMATSTSCKADTECYLLYEESSRTFSEHSNTTYRWFGGVDVYINRKIIPSPTIITPHNYEALPYWNYSSIYVGGPFDGKSRAPLFERPTPFTYSLYGAKQYTAYFKNGLHTVHRVKIQSP